MRGTSHLHACVCAAAGSVDRMTSFRKLRKKKKNFLFTRTGQEINSCLLCGLPCFHQHAFQTTGAPPSCAIYVFAEASSKSLLMVVTDESVFLDHLIRSSS